MASATFVPGKQISLNVPVSPDFGVTVSPKTSIL